MRDRVTVTGVHLPSASAPPGERPPFALGMVMAYARKVLGADGAFDVGFATSVAEAEKIAAQPGQHVFLFSDYMWSAPENLACSRHLKSIDPRVVCVHGGPHVPSYPAACEAHLRRERHVDYAVRGEGEEVLVDILRAVAEGDFDRPIPNVARLVGDRFVQHAPRERPKDLDRFPSPYLDGTLEPLGPERWQAGIVETNRGCPYGCTFCDWGAATLQRIRTFDIERVRAEVTWLAERRVPVLWTADANFGILPRDVEIARIIVDAKKRFGFPKLVVTNYAKNTHQHLLDILELYLDAGLLSTGVISIQSRDAQTLDIVRRKNIKTREYDKLRAEFQRRGFPLAVQLMIGLPGATLGALKDDLAFYFDQAIEVQLFRTVVLPNSPMAEPSYVAAHGLRYREDGLLLSTSTMSEADFELATRIGRVFNAVHHYGVLRYPLVYLHAERGVAPMDAMHAIAGSKAPLLSKMANPGANPLDMFEPPSDLLETCRRDDRWSDLASELAELFTIEDTSAWRAVTRAWIATMPARGRAFPSTVELEHDVARWYRDRVADGARPLASYAPSSLTVEDPLAFSSRPYAMDRLTRRQWELASPLAFARAGRTRTSVQLREDGTALPWPVMAHAPLDQEPQSSSSVAR